MTDPQQAAGCQVSLLVPHARRAAVLMARTDEEPHQWLLPTIELETKEPTLPMILAAVDVVDVAGPPVLRLVMTSAASDDESAAVSYLVEFDAAASEPPDGWIWQDLDDDVLAQLEPEHARATVTSWSHERADGWSPLRPQWSLPGWFGRASTWLAEQMTVDAHPATGAPQQHQLWGISTVLRTPSAAGDAFFKCSAQIFDHEAVLTKALAARMPGHLPEVIAINSEHGWLLMRDLGAAELGDLEESLWHEGVRAHAAIQQSWLGRTEELVALGLPLRSLTDLARQVDDIAHDATLMGRMSIDLRRRWLAAAPALAESCRRLDQTGPGPTLVHGDFHPWNVAHGPVTTRIFDWTDAAVSHPFVDLVTYVIRTEDRAVRRQLVDAYIGAWSQGYSEATLREAADLALVVGALYQVQTYRMLLPALMHHGADDGLAGGDLGWIERALSLESSTDPS